MILGIFGAGALGREVLEIVLEVNAGHTRWSRIVFLADIGDVKTVDGIEVITPAQFAQLKEQNEPIEAIVAVGNPNSREKMADKLMQLGIPLSNPIVHPWVRLSLSAKLGKGTVVNSFTTISVDAVVGDNVYIQPHCGVGHNVTVGRNCVISAGARIAGCCDIGQNTYIGMMVPVRDRVQIGSNCVISLGSVVQRDIPDGVTAIGNPARPMKRSDEGKLF